MTVDAYDISRVLNDPEFQLAGCRQELSILDKEIKARETERRGMPLQDIPMDTAMWHKRYQRRDALARRIRELETQIAAGAA